MTSPPQDDRSDWNLARPEKPPQPSIWPVTLSLAITLMVWGLISLLVVSAFGVVLFGVALTAWIQEIRHERENQ